MTTRNLKIKVCEFVYIGEDEKETVPPPMPSPFFQTDFVFTMQDERWAPAQSRAPAVFIDFELNEAAF